MSLYKEYEKTASVYHPNDSTATKITTFPSTADFTVKMFIIRRNEDAATLLGDEIGEYVAHVNKSYTNASSIQQGDKIVWDGNTYYVENKPKLVRLFNKYKLILRGNDQRIV